jgi:hypothetical protein
LLTRAAPMGSAAVKGRPGGRPGVEEGNYCWMGVSDRV